MSVLPSASTRLPYAMIVGLLACAPSARAVDFLTEVAPILEAKCLGCHNPNIVKGELSMATRADILKAGQDILIPGNAEESVLHWITLPFDDDEPPEMPEEGDPLTEDEMQILADWINSGASWPEEVVLKEQSKSDKSWWAYQPLVSPRLDSIDTYIESKLSELELEFNPEADRRTLIRRATYDLIGLPPSMEEVDVFVRDPDPLAYEKLIDRLLDSPHYGERWGRHWLDVVRFGESVGFEQNWMIKDLWPFRDYVIRSINEDKPFDVFFREHLAGDLIGSGDPDVEIGSAFLVTGPHDTVNNQDAAQTAQIRANTLDEIINASSGAFLGMTVSCARCHDHKFDPISQADYYRLYTAFSGVRHGSSTWTTLLEKKARSERLKPLNQKRAALQIEIERLEKTILNRSFEKLDSFEANWTRPSADRTGTEDTFAPIEAKFVRLVCEAQDLNPETSNGFRLDEFEVWSAEPKPRNVALASNGSVAQGKAREIEDFPNAYGSQHTNDGRIGTRFIAASDRLTIELAAPTRVNRVFFSSAQGEQAPELFKFAFVADYRIEASLDGKNWVEVANGKDRKPVSKKYPNPAKDVEDTNLPHLDYRLIQLGANKEEANLKKRWEKELAITKKEISKLPPLRTAWLGKRSEEDAKGPFHIFIGGSPQRLGAEVAPASLSTLSDVVPEYELSSESSEAVRRFELANWVTHAENPLTPRVLANRIWHYHFGTGIVNTPNDFGYMGGRPTHPELLDFLALELIDNDWKLKALHRTIMNSKVYRQSSEWREDGGEVDSDSRLLWRFPPRRLSAEEIRDTVLTVAGKLNPKMGGPGFRLYQYMRDNVSTYEPLDEHGSETYRRAVYHQNVRASVVDLMTDFDQADCTLSIPRRSETTTPLQALTMMNHQFTIDMAERMAERVRELGHSNPVEQVVQVFCLAHQRDPDEEEIRVATQVIEAHGLRALCRAVLNSSELIYLD